MTSEEAVAAAPVEEVEIIRCDVPITVMIRSKQRVYGCPENQFQRYAEYCTHRTARLRKYLRVKGFPNCELNPTIKQNSQHIQFLVVTAEGAWARYRDLKNTATGGQRRQHALRRLRKCLKWWKMAQEAAEVFGSERTQTEIRAFSLNAEATLLMEMGKWAESHKLYTEVNQIFANLAESSTDNAFNSFAKEIIEDNEPLLVFCQYNLGGDAAAKVSVSAETRAKVSNIHSFKSISAAVRKVDKIEWRDRTIQIPHEGLKVKFASIEDLITDTNSNHGERDFRLSLFDRLITETHSARQIVQTLLASAEDKEDLGYLDHYLRWHSFIAMLERSRLMIDTLPTAAERADFAGRTFQRIVEMHPGFPEDPAIEALELVWHAAKCYNIGLAHMGAEKLAMLDRARKHCSDGLGVVNSEDVTDPQSLKEWASELLVEIRRARVAAVAEMNGIHSEADGGKPFLSDLKDYAPCETLVKVPPVARKAAPKPILYDIAGGFLDFPNLDGKLKKKGIASLLKFW